MGELGEILRQAREDKGLSLAQVEEAIKIRSTYLQALEEGDFERLPAPVYVRGFLKNYAQFLGLDVEQVLSLHEGPRAQTGASVPSMLDEPLEPLSWRRWWPLGVVLLVIVAAAIGLWSYQRYYGTLPFLVLQPEPTPTTAPTLTVSIPSPTTPLATATAVPTQTATATPTRSPTPTAVALELSIEIVGQRSWVLVIADGERVFAGILEPGAKDTWTARERISLRAGVPNAVIVTLNGESLGQFGEAGEVVEKEWTVPGAPTVTPVPTTGT